MQYCIFFHRKEATKTDQPTIRNLFLENKSFMSVKKTEAGNEKKTNRINKFCHLGKLKVISKKIYQKNNNKYV